MLYNQIDFIHFTHPLILVISPSPDLLNHQRLTQQILIIIYYYLLFFATASYKWIISLSPFIKYCIYAFVFSRDISHYNVSKGRHCAVRPTQTEFDWDISPFLITKTFLESHFTRFLSKFFSWKCTMLTFLETFSPNCIWKRRNCAVRQAQTEFDWDISPFLRTKLHS